MSDNIQNLATFAAIALPPIVIAVGWAFVPLHPRHPPEAMVPHAGRRNYPVVATPSSGAHPQQPNPQLAHLPQPYQLVHPEGPVAALAPPSPPPNYHEYLPDTRIDGAPPSYTNTGSSRGSTVSVVPSPNQNPPPPENADVEEGEEGGHV
ncbi:hypothetical protein M407DRAFT_219322 [Tulasnella calospora MUT 4182]|uniref:Uncharacterized protein n=1 Tax=Tulasnella calospora MUT 4182 TaxID=1051891 RepID=A0A0C3QRU1_9AGAM|nr:hypothetical protein M407DRAFT_219322 [Tulasnella calospora MUT 4182]